MPRLQTITTNFTAGELSPRLRGRVDIARYNNAAAELLNCYPVIHGGAYSRPGTIYTGAAKNANKKARAIPFVVSRAAAYVIELGDQYLRLWKNGARVGTIELATPWTEAQLFEVDYAQDASTMFLAHPAWPIYRLQTFGETLWTLAAAPFTATPFAEIGTRPNTTLTLSAATVGVGRTATAGASAFLPADVGRAILYQQGIGVITAYTSATVVTIEITQAFTGTSIGAGVWKIDSSPQAACTPGGKDPVGATITLDLTSGVPPIDGWRSEDVGKFVRINGGLVRIDTFTSASEVEGTIIKELTGVTAAQALAWSLEAPVWNAVDGYPSTLTFYQQRLIAAGSTGYPQTIWGSRSGEYLDFTGGTDDADGFSFTIASDETNQIAYLAATRDLIALTYGAEYSLRGGIEKPITPTNVTIRPESNHGCATVRPVLVGKETLFVQRAGRKLRSLGYRYDFDGYAAPDLAALAEHITAGGVVDMAWQQEPDAILWLARGDGKLVSLTFDREQEVIGWALHDVGGVVESLATVPTATAEAIYMLVRRTVNGATVRLLERIEQSAGAQFDCCSIQSGAAAATWQHAGLPLTTVEALADGAYMGELASDVSGTIALPRNATSVQIGLPFTARVVPLPPEVGTGTGTAAGQAMSTNEIRIRVLETGPLTVNDQQITFQRFGAEVLDQPPAPYTGDHPVSNLGWKRGESEITIERALPFQMHLLAIIRSLTVNA